ncbi:flagellar hook capping FlgD N-terminal domain-containing protein [Salipiger sp. H15]|uniref:Basal-body rod modification protein FlgD n=1 Tax=Alloyangia sp. H15 TaxID=3029062 RepID=A0AAU8AJP0_9RHOB
MDLSALTQVSTGTSSTGTAASSASASDFDTFLKMLTTQAQNQDPFNPVDATEYASQLASFSAVEQQVMTNELLSSLTALAGAGGFERLASWIGLETLAPGAARFDGAPVDLYFDPVEETESVVLVLRDASGSVQSRITLPAGSDSYTWEGSDLAGAALPDGIYGAEIEVTRDGVLAETRDAYSYMRIDEVSRGEDGLVLTLRGGDTLDASSAAAVRRPAT